MWIGVGIAIVLCAAVGVALDQSARSCPSAAGGAGDGHRRHRRRRRHLHDHLDAPPRPRHQGDARGRGRDALAAGSTIALVAMAFLAVLREGFETSVFLLAAFQDASDTTAAGAGAVLGLAGGGGDRPRPLSRRRPHQPDQVLPDHRPRPRPRRRRAARTAAHTAHEAGWINGLQGQAVDLTWLVQPGTISGSLLTGMLGLQPSPTVIEATVYLAYAVPMPLYVVWPDQLRRRPRDPRPRRSGHRRDRGLSRPRARDEPLSPAAAC